MKFRTKNLVRAGFLAVCLFPACFAAAADTAKGGEGTATAVRKTLVTRLDAYAQVEPTLSWKLLPPEGCPAPSRGLLWIKASYYGADISALRSGMTGLFYPDGGGKPVAVRVCSVFDLLDKDGGRSAALVAAEPSPGWFSGELGTVALDGPARKLVAVPTRALILDKGRWWVLVRTPGGDVPKAVVPGPARGWETYLESGLEPGDEVVVDDAYLEFHRDIAGSYQPPD
jgi:hypothetical protein